MPYIKLTKPSFANLTGQLPGKKFRGVSFVNGVSVANLPLAVADKFAAQLPGVMLCSSAGVVSGPAGSLYRKTSIVPTPVIPRAAKGVAQSSDAAIAALVNPLTQRHANHAIFYGDSRMAMYYADAGAPRIVNGRERYFRTTALHFIAQANARIGNRLRVVRTFARSGFRSDEYLTDANIAAGIATDAKWAFIFGVVNDIGQLQPKGDPFDLYIKPACERLIAAGITPILFTEPGGENFSSNTTGRSYVYEYNHKLRTYAAERPAGQVYVFDLASIVLNGKAAGIDIINDFTTDGVHYTPAMGVAVGRALADFLRSIIPALPLHIPSAGEVLVGGRQGFSNPGFANQAAAGAVAKTNATGDFPVGTTQAIGTSGVSAVGSLVDNVYGTRDLNLVITATQAGRFRLVFDVAAGFDNPGDLIDITAQAEVADGAVGLIGTNLFAQANRSSLSLEMDSLWATSADKAPLVQKAEIIDHRIEGYVPAGTRNWFTVHLNAHFATAGSATIKWRHLSVLKR